jgi:hypothetical protein
MTYSRHLMTGTIFQGRETLRQVIDFLVPEVGLEPTRRVDPRGILSPNQPKIHTICNLAVIAVSLGLAQHAADFIGWRECADIWVCLGLAVTEW